MSEVVVHKKDLVLIITPALTGGSWIALKNMIESPDERFRYAVLGLGNYRSKSKNFSVVSIPYFRYDGKIGVIISKYTILGFIYEIPLYLAAAARIIFSRPRVVVFNGLNTLLPLLPFAKISGSRVVLSFASWFDYKRFSLIENPLRSYGKFVDLVIANSIGTKENLSALFPREKIMVVEHCANDIFFEERDRVGLRRKWDIKEKFVVAYIGRIDYDKHCGFLLDVVRELIDEKGILFLFVGRGVLEKEVIALQEKHRTVEYLGYIADVNKLSEIYSIADVVWSYSDETYLALPAVEALASGTPIIIPSTPAIEEKITNGARIEKPVFPPEVGWAIDLEDPGSVAKLILDMRDRSLAAQKRKDCSRYAQSRYHKNNHEAFHEFLVGRLL